jgi:hypothetical protein
VAKAWNEACAGLRAAEEVDYASVAAAKREMFERLFAHFSKNHLAAATRRARAFTQFRESRGQPLRRHALHEALQEFHGKGWRDWPAEHQDPASEAVQRFAAERSERIGLYEYLQWQADLQLAEAQARCRELGMPVGLYADLAISIGGDGSEAWANQGLYALGVSVGAPPDEFNTQGQDWGLPPLSPDLLLESAYAPLVATLRANMARAGALRIDHVMGLARLYWVPHGHEGYRRRLRALSGGRHARHRGAREPAAPLHGDRRGPRHRRRKPCATSSTTPRCSPTACSCSSATAPRSSRRRAIRAARWSRGPRTTCPRSPAGGARTTSTRARSSASSAARSWLRSGATASWRARRFSKRWRPSAW